MKRIIILLVAIGLVCAFPASAMAGKPDKPPKTDTWEVTMSGALETTTDCSGDDHIIMKGRIPGSYISAAEAKLEVNLPIYWSRYYPSPNGLEVLWGDPLTGCHGGPPVVEQPEDMNQDPFGGKLVLYVDDDTVTFHWRFDYYWQFGWDLSRKRSKVQQQVLEMFQLDSEALGLFDPNSTDSQTLTGAFTLQRFLNEADDAHPDDQGWKDPDSNLETPDHAEVTVTLTIKPAG